MAQTYTPISFAIHSSKFDAHATATNKLRAFSAMIPGGGYSYFHEAEYNGQYAEAYYAVTHKKCGWDCLRHYEIIAAGCVPYFDNIDGCPDNTMHTLPKALVKQAMALPGVDRSTLSIDFSVFPKEEYFALRDAIVDHAKKHLTTRALASYVASTCGVTLSQESRVLFVNVQPTPDYQKVLLLTGFKEILGRRCVVMPYEEDYIYDEYSEIRKRSLYGRGFNYTKVVPSGSKSTEDDIRSARSDLRNFTPGAFDLIVFGSWHRRQPNPDEHDIVSYIQRFNTRTAVVCGEDIHACSLCQGEASGLGENAVVFIRELGNAIHGYNDPVESR